MVATSMSPRIACGDERIGGQLCRACRLERRSDRNQAREQNDHRPLDRGIDLAGRHETQGHHRSCANHERDGGGRHAENHERDGADEHGERQQDAPRGQHELTVGKWQATKLCHDVGKIAGWPLEQQNIAGGQRHVAQARPEGTSAPRDRKQIRVIACAQP
jgi:hypothetical protein